MVVVVTGGRLATISAGAPPALAGTIQLADQVYSDLASIYRCQPQVRTVVGFLARNIAQLGLHTFRRKDDDDRERVAGHPLAKLLKTPAPGRKLTRYQLINRLVSDIAIYDTAYWVKARDGGGAVVGIVPVPVTRVTPLGDGWISPDGYRIVGARGQVDLGADDVVHFHGYNPDDLRTGMSPLEALRSVLQEEFQASLHRQQLWRNGARTAGFIQRPKDAPTWSPTARDRFKADFRAVYTGAGSGAGGVPILEDGMTYVAAGLDPKAAQYIEGRKLTREEVASAYYIAPPLVGILDHATFSNIREQHKNLYQDTLGPWLEQIQEDIELQLLPDLDDDPDIYCEFNIAGKMAGSFEEQSAQLQTAVGGPWMLRNEARARMNLPALDGGDELITPLNVLVGGQASPTDSAPTGALPAAPDGGTQPASEEDT